MSFNPNCSFLKTKMTSFFVILFFVIFPIHHIQSSSLFDIQDTLTILCNQFPLISTFNSSLFQCARLRTDRNVLSTSFDLDNPTRIILFITIDEPPSITSPLNIIIDFDQSPDQTSSLAEIRVVIFVNQATFTLNNHTTTIYNPQDLPVLRWYNSTPDTYDLLEVLQIDSNELKNDATICQWNFDRWTKLFYDNNSINVPYVYFLKTTTTQLTFVLTGTINVSSTLSPYLDVLYCIPYKLGTTEWVLLIGFSVLFFITVIILAILHYRKVDDTRPRHFHLHHRGSHERLEKKHLPKKKRSATRTSDVSSTAEGETNDYSR